MSTTATTTTTVLNLRGSGRFEWRNIQPRPRIRGRIIPASIKLWPRFAPYHYMAARIHPMASCFALEVQGQSVAFAAILNSYGRSPRPRRRVHRVVVLPDWQGLGLGQVLLDVLGAAYAAVGIELRLATANWMFARSLARHGWRIAVRGHLGRRSRPAGVQQGNFGGRMITTLVYRGPAHAEAAQILLLGREHPVP